MAFYIVPYFRKKENHLFLKSDIYKAKHAAVHGAISHIERKPWRIHLQVRVYCHRMALFFPLSQLVHTI